MRQIISAHISLELTRKKVILRGRESSSIYSDWREKELRICEDMWCVLESLLNKRHWNFLWCKCQNSEVNINFSVCLSD